MGASMSDCKYIKKPMALIQDKRLSSCEADYLCLIHQLHMTKGCTASNTYFGNYFAVARQTAQEVIGKLKKKKFIATSEKKQGGKTVERKITIIDAVSKNNLLMISRKLPTELAGNSDKVSRKSANHTLDDTKDNNNTNSFFDLFWKEYPKKTAKQDALKAFDKLNVDTKLLETILSAIKKQMSSTQWQQNNGQYIPQPATWLNGKRWEDEMKTPAIDSSPRYKIIKATENI